MYNHFATQQEGSVTVLVLLDPKLSDTLIVSELHDELIDFVVREAPRFLLIDFHKVSHCSTAIINGLISAKKRLLSRAGKLKLCGMRSPVRGPYKLLNLDGTVFDIHDSVQQALESFEKSSTE